MNTAAVSADIVNSFLFQRKPGCFTDAIKLCELAVSKHTSDNTDFYYLKSIACLKAGLFNDALIAINSTLSIKPSHKEFLLLKAQILESMGCLADSFKILSALKETESSPQIEEAYARVKHSIDSGSSNSLSHDEKEFYAKYTDWMKSVGAKFSKIELKYFQADYRGVVATGLINKGDIIISVPKEAMITLKMAKQSPVGKKIISAGTSLIYPNNSLLSTYVLLEKANPKSQWTSLINALPNSVSNFPIFFTNEEKAWLTGSQFLPAIEELRKDMEKDYNRICSVAPEFAKVATLEDFMKTRALVNSRIFGTRIDGEENDSIVPFADMFNYKYKSDMTHWTYSAELKAFVVRAKDTIKPGEEIFVYYGNKPNANFFQFYGFVIENNENDEICLEVAIDSKDPLKELKMEMLDREPRPKKFKVAEKTDDEKFEHLVSYLRFIAFEDSSESLKKLKTMYAKGGKNEPEFKALTIPPLSKENEEKALGILQKLCEQNLAKFPDTLEADLERLKKGGLTYNEKNCIILRAGEKRVYKFHIQLAKHVTEMLRGQSKTIVTDLAASWPKMRSYLASIQHLITN